MNIVEVLLPLETRNGIAIGTDRIEREIAGLAELFGGATAFTRAPAEGLWKAATETQRDSIVIVEVVLEAVAEDWWREYKARLEADFEQDEIMIRVTECRLI